MLKIDYTRTASGSEPITTAQMKNYLRENYGTDAVEDALVDEFVKAARQWVEEQCQQSFVAQEIVLWAYDDECLITDLPLSFGPVTAISEVVRLDEKEAETALVFNSDYYVLGLSDKTITFNRMFSTGSVTYQPIKATYTAGYASAASIPRAIVAAIYKLAAESYVNREASVDWSIQTVPYGVAQLIRPYQKIQW